MKIKTNSNLTSGILFMLVSIALYLSLPSQIQTMETTDITAATVPDLLIKGMFLCSLVLIITGMRSKDKTTYEISLKRLKEPEVRVALKPIIYMVMLLIYAVILPYIGFLIATLLLVNSILAYFGTKKWYFYCIASANVLVAYYVFRMVLSVSLP